MGERGEFLPAGPTPCTVKGCPREGVHPVNGRRYCGGHAAELIDPSVSPPRTGEYIRENVAPVVVWPDGEAARLSALDAQLVVRLWLAGLADGQGRHVPLRQTWPQLADALDALAERWPQ